VPFARETEGPIQSGSRVTEPHCSLLQGTNSLITSRNIDFGRDLHLNTMGWRLGLPKPCTYCTSYMSRRWKAAFASEDCAGRYEAIRLARHRSWQPVVWSTWRRI